METKKTIRINATGPSYFWNPTSSYHFIYEFLERHFKIEICDKPDYLICDANNFLDLKWHDCVKICFTIENILPDFNRYDYAMGFDYLDFGDRYCRMPLFAAYGAYRKLEHRQENMPTDEELLNRKFCSFVVSNATGANPIREHFFRQLSKYKRVDSGGRFMNNIGGPVADKNEFCKQYKFNIAFENSSHPGYVTEKIMQPYTVYSVPIYYGHHWVDRDFNRDSMVYVAGMEDVDRAIDEIMRLDQNDDLYLERCKTSPLVRPFDYFTRTREAFLANIFSQSVEKASRTAGFGYQPAYRTRLTDMVRLNDLLKSPFRLARRILSRRK